MKSIYSLFILMLMGHGISAQANLEWKFQTQGRVYSSPLATENMVVIGSGDHVVYALDKDSGELQWKFPTGGAVHSSPAAGKGMIFAGSADGNLYALEALTGKLSWTFASKGEKMVDLWDYYLSSPVFQENKVYWASGDGSVYALDAMSGEMLWEFKTEGPVHASPVIEQDKVLVGSFDGNLYALDKNSGDLEWKFKTLGAQYFPKGEIQKGVEVYDGVVYFGSRDYNLYAVELESGRCLWNYREPKGWIIAKPLADQERLYFGTSDAHKFYCLEKASGEILWSIPLRMRSYGNPVKHKNTIYFGTFDGWVIGASQETGELQWQFQTSGSKQNYDSIYDESGEWAEGFELYGKDYLESEKRIHSLGSVLSTPAIKDEVIYFGSSDGFVYAVRL